MTDVIDIKPFLKRKKERECEHHRVLVGMKSAELTCDECSAELDPWWYLRKLVEREEAWDACLAAQTKYLEDQRARGNAIITEMSERIARLTREVTRLQDTKNKLINESHNGRLLGAIVAHPRRKRRA